jgi:hypothetical protein
MAKEAVCVSWWAMSVDDSVVHCPAVTKFAVALGGEATL